MCRGQRLTLSVLVSSPSYFSLRNNVAGHHATGMSCLALGLQICVPPHLAFHMGLGELLTLEQQTLYWTHLPKGWCSRAWDWLYSLGQPWTQDPPASTSQVMELQAWATKLGLRATVSAIPTIYFSSLPQKTDEVQKNATPKMWNVGTEYGGREWRSRKASLWPSTLSPEAGYETHNSFPFPSGLRQAIKPK